MTTPPPTATVVDAAVKLRLPVRWLPPPVRPVIEGRPYSGPAHPVTHAGSVDALLEAVDDAPPGAVLVIDNGGRLDEACIGDLVALEAQGAGVAAIVVWGLHRDTAQLCRIGLPVHSLGATPAGPRRVPPAAPAMRAASVDGILVAEGDLVVGDDDGVVIVPAAHADEVLVAARAILRTETAQADRMRAGDSLRSQIDFAGYLRDRAFDPSLSLREHLARRGGAVET